MFAVMADLLTLSRLIAAGILFWLGLQGPQTLTLAIVVCVLGWTTDQLDGWAARRATTPTRLGAADFVIDAVLYAATLAYLALTGYLPRIPVMAFVCVALAASLAFRRKAVAIVFVRLIDLACFVIIFRYRPLAGGLLLLWLALTAVIYRRRLAERVPPWVRELIQLAGLRRSHRGEM